MILPVRKEPEPMNGRQALIGFPERLYMHPDRGIIRTDRWSDVLSMRPDGPNNLTCQSISTNDAPQVTAPQNHYMESCLETAQSKLQYIYVYGPGTPSTSQSPRAFRRCTKSLPIFASGIQHYHHNWNQQFHYGRIF